MLNIKWVLGKNNDHCDTCLRAADQVHPMEVWLDAGIYPGSASLFCGNHCHCQFAPTTEPEKGDLSDISIRKGEDMPEQTKRHSRFNLASSIPNQAGDFEIVAITAGEGNGWQFPENVLRDSLSLWDKASSFIDHSWDSHSVKDLAGMTSNPCWDEAIHGIKLNLHPIGPSSQLLTEVGEEVLANPDGPSVGFSADILFSATGNQVTKIHKVYSVDLVIDPARGGQFLRALNSLQKGLQDMPPEIEPVTPPTAENNDDVRTALCNDLLESRLTLAQLPVPVTELIRKQFAGKVFKPADLDRSIEDQRAALSAVQAAETVQGPRLSGMATSEDQISVALHDLLGLQRPAGMESINPAKLSGIREFYTRMTGDFDFHGGYDRSRAQFALTTDLPGVLKNAMNKLISARWEELGRSGYRWWEPIVQVEHFTSLQDITGVLVGEVTILPSVAEGNEYTELDVSDSSETGTWGKYGGYVGLTLEMFERDETHKLRQYPNKLASAALRNISALVGSIFTANSGVGPAMADTYKVFDAANHANLGTSALASATWEAASKAIYDQTMVIASGGTAPKLALDAKYLLVPRALRLTGMNILYPSFAHESNIFSENMQKGQMGDVITVPEFSDANDWAAVADPKLAPGIILAERFGVMPEIIIADGEANGALFTNDEIRMKVRHWVSVFVADHRPLYKANVA